MTPHAYEGVSVEGGENSFAFLIFNSDYHKGISPVTDVDKNKQGMLVLLSGLALPAENIFVLENPSKSDLEDEIYEFSRQLNSKSDLLVYYNGHSVNFADTPDNEILLTSFKLPRSNDLFLLERRVSRSSVSLEAMISEFTPKRVGHITVFYDACNAHFVARPDDAEHWEVFNRINCAGTKVSGADVFYAGGQIGEGSLVNALTDVLSKKPTIDLLALQTALLERDANRGDAALTPVFVAGSRSENLADVCLRRSMQDGKLSCNIKQLTAKVEVAKVADSSDETVPVVDKVKPTTSVENKKKTQEKRRSMRDDWAAAKRSGTCKPYQDFVANYPNAVFKVKAQMAVSQLCAAEPKVEIVKTETVVETPDVVTQVDEIEEPPVVEIETVSVEPAVEKKLPKKANLMRDDWAAAKRSGTCKPYQDFVANYPNAVFKAKAERAISNLCAVTPKKEVASEQPDIVAPTDTQVPSEDPDVTTKDPETTEVAKTDVIMESTEELEILEIPVKETTPEPEPKAPVGKKKNSFQSWMAARKMNTCAGYQEFLENHPKTVFALKAQKNIDRLCVEKQAEEVAVAKTEPPETVSPTVVDEDKIPGAKIAAIQSVLYEAKGEVVVRSGPGTDYPAIATLVDNQDVTIVKSILLSNGQLWLKLQKNERVGYAVATDLTEVVIASTTEPVEPADEPKATPEPVVDKPDVTKPVGELPASQLWLITRAGNTCNGYLSFLEKHPKSLFSLKAKLSAGRLCNDADRLAFNQKSNVVVPEVKATKETPPLEPVIVTPVILPDNAACTGDAISVYLTKATIPVLTAPDGSEQFSYLRDMRVRIINELEDYLVIRVASRDSDFKCGYIRKNAKALKKLETIQVALPKVADVKKPTKVPTATGGFAAISEEAAKNHYALLIVNQEYTSGLGTVAGAKRDKEAILAIIAGLKYPKENVKLLLNASRTELEDAVFDFALGMRPQSDLLVYYSGHSLTSLSGKTNLILPANFIVPDNKQTRLSRRRFNENSIALDVLIKDLKHGDPRQITVIYNACGNQALPADKDVPYWLFLKPTPCSAIEIEGASVFYPVKDGQFAILGLGKNDNDKRSLFMRVFEDVITKNPAIDITELQKELAWSVSAMANRRKAKPREQDPVFRDGYTVDIEAPRQRCFAKTMVNGALACTTMEGLGNNVETSKTDPKTAQTAWLEAKQVDTCEAYQGFNKKFPNTIYSIKVIQKITENCANVANDILILLATCEATGNASLPFGLTRIGYQELQIQLNRLGCDVGTADGAWGRNSQAGFDLLKKWVNLDEDTTKPSCANLEQITALPTKRICPLICGSGFEKIGDECVRVQPIAKAPTATSPTVTKKSAAPTVSKTITKTPTAPAAVTKCSKGKILKDGRCIRNTGFLGNL